MGRLWVVSCVVVLAAVSACDDPEMQAELELAEDEALRGPPGTFPGQGQGVNGFPGNASSAGGKSILRIALTEHSEWETG